MTLKKPKPNLKKLSLLLEQLYPEVASELNFSNEYQLVIAVILSAQCTDKKVNQVTPILFERYPDFESLSKAELTDLQTILKPINYYITKSKNLLACAKLMVSEFDSKVPLNHKSLLLLPGVGRKTANVVLGELGAQHTLPVDTHVFRVAQRLGIAKGKTPDEIEKQLCAQFPSEQWRGLHHRLIFHGRRVCKAQNPLCGECGLQGVCPSRK